MKKGFTLIELLAVIVILAIIALIATPIVLNIINDAKESAMLRSADFYLEGVETAIATSVLKGITISDGTYSIMQDGNLCIGTLNGTTCTGDMLKVEMDGEVPSSGTITITEGQIEKISLNLNDKTITKNNKGELVLGETQKELAPGLYDENDNLIASWEELEREHDIKDAIELSMDYGYYVSNILSENYENASKLVIDKSVTYIGIEAFNDCTTLTEIIIPDSVTRIEDSAFQRCTNLKSIIIPDGVTRIPDYAFSGCTSLTGITIPNSVTNIGIRSFAGSGITNIAIPNSVSKIEDSAFHDCINLTSVIISKSVTDIFETAFYNCYNLTTINYTGTEEEWNAISKGYEWDEGTPSNKEINYNYKG